MIPRIPAGCPCEAAPQSSCGSASQRPTRRGSNDQKAVTHSSSLCKLEPGEKSPGLPPESARQKHKRPHSLANCEGCDRGFIALVPCEGLVRSGAPQDRRRPRRLAVPRPAEPIATCVQTPNALRPSVVNTVRRTRGGPAWDCFDVAAPGCCMRSYCIVRTEAAFCATIAWTTLVG
jgi:hypothetical protein